MLYFPPDFDEFLLCVSPRHALGVTEGVVSKTWIYSQEKEKTAGVGNRRECPGIQKTSCEDHEMQVMSLFVLGPFKIHKIPIETRSNPRQVLSTVSHFPHALWLMREQCRNLGTPEGQLEGRMTG